LGRRLLGAFGGEAPGLADLVEGDGGAVDDDVLPAVDTEVRAGRLDRLGLGLFDCRLGLGFWFGLGLGFYNLRFFIRVVLTQTELRAQTGHHLFSGDALVVGQLESKVVFKGQGFGLCAGLGGRFATLAHAHAVCPAIMRRISSALLARGLSPWLGPGPMVGAP
jgi:hypothetical protein